MQSRAGLAALIVGLGGLNLLILGLVILGFIVYSTETRPGPTGTGPVLGHQAETTSASSVSASRSAKGSPRTRLGRSGPLPLHTPEPFWSRWWNSYGPPIGGIYACDTCRGYPSGSHYSNDSWRWID